MTRGTHKLLIGDVRDTLRTLEAGSVQTCVTSPPYWGLRSYDTGDSKHLEIGSERTPEEFIATMVDVFGLVRQALRADGTLWLNLGDCYSSGGRVGHGTRIGHKQESNIGALLNKDAARPEGFGLGDGNQLLMPHRVALALQADGWILRSTVIWHKRSPMPESVSGWRWIQRQHAAGNSEWVLRRGKWRPTTGHEYVFLFSKNARYYCNGDAVAETASPSTARKLPFGRTQKHRTKQGTAGIERANASFEKAVFSATETRNPRSVWSLSSEPYKGAHFATFPSELVRRCIMATTPAQCCSACGAGYAPMVVTERVPTPPGVGSKVYENTGAAHHDSPYLDHAAIGNRDPQRHIQRTSIEGYRPTCDCQAPPCRAVVLDPFTGSGTTIQTAVWYGRDAVGCELSGTYATMAEARIATMPRCMARDNDTPRPRLIPPEQRQLFAANDP